MTKWCVKDGVSKMVGDKVVCERWFAKEGGCHQAPHLPRKTKVDVSKCDACHVKRRWMSPSALPGTQSGSRCHQVPRLPRKVEVHGRQVPRLPRKVTVHVAKGHACHANSGGVYGVNWEPSAPPEPAQCHKCHACHAECTYKLCEDKLCVSDLSSQSCVRASCVMTSCVWTSCVWTSGVRTSCVGAIW